VTEPRILVLGAGSIGSRHARNLLALGAVVDVADDDPRRASSVDGATSVAPDAVAMDAYDGVVVATPTSLHAEHGARALDAGRKVLIEKPLARTVADVDALRALDRVMVGYNLRLHEPLVRLHELTERGVAGTVRLARFWFGSYLPDWRPAVDYRSTYSAIAALGGGVLLDAIHELDLVVWWFGTEVAVRGGVVATAGSLELDVEDSVQAVLQAPSGATIGVSLDYLSRSYRRGVELVGDDATLRYDWQRGAIEVETHAGREVTPVDVPVSQSYERQAERFLAWIVDDAPPPVDGFAGRASLRLASEIGEVGR
jgi:predicted dehydrogenase